MSDFTAFPPPPRKMSGPLTADDLATLNDEIAAMARAWVAARPRAGASREGKWAPDACKS